MVGEREASETGSGLGSEFAKLWAASAASNLGDGVWLVAAPLLAVTLTRDPALVAGFAVAQRLPWLLFGLIGGALADRLDRRRAMVAVALLSTLRGAFRPARDEETLRGSLWSEIAVGVRWLWGQRLLRALSLTLALLNLTLVAQVAIMVLFAEERLGLGPQGYGALLAVYGVGGGVGSLVAERVLARVGEAVYLRLAVVIEAAAPAIIVLSTSPLVVGLVLALFGVHAIVRGALLTALRQEITPDPLRGRVSSVHALLEYGSAAPGALLGGLLAARFELTAPFWLGAITGLALIAIVWPLFTEAEIAAARENAD